MPQPQRDVEDWWNTQHKKRAKEWLTGSTLTQYLNFFRSKHKYKNAKTVLEVGVGLGTATKRIFREKGEVYAVDISEKALQKVSHFANVYTTSNTESDIPTLDQLPTGVIDIAFSFLVAQHISDEMLVHHIHHVTRALKKTGVFCLQYAVDLEPDCLYNKQSADYQKKGGVVRTPEQVDNLVSKAAELFCCHEVSTRSSFKQRYPGKEVWQWGGVHIYRKDYYHYSFDIPEDNKERRVSSIVNQAFKREPRH